MGGPSASSFTPTETKLDPALRPKVDLALSEAERLYNTGGPAYYSGDTYVKPSTSTQVALQLAQNRAAAGNPLLGQAQGSISSLMNTQSPYESQYAGMAGRTSGYGSVFDQIGQAQSPYQQQFSNLAQNAYVDPNQAFYESMRGGAMQNEALAGTRATSQGAYLGGSPYLEGALSQANRLSAESLQEGIRGLQSKTSMAGRYGSGAEQQLAGKMTDAAARALAEQNQQAYLQNYQQERGLQEQALQSLGGLSQQGFVNQLTGAQGLGTAAQQAFANQMGATQAAQNVYGSDLANRMAAAQAGQNVYQSDYANQMSALAGAQGVRGEDIATRMAAAGMAPGLAAADYADIDRLLAAGQVGEGYTAAQQAADKERYDYTANLPYASLEKFGSFITGLPRGGITTEYVAPQTEAEKAAASARNTDMQGRDWTSAIKK